MDTETILERLGRQLRAQRTQRGLTQAQIAERAGVPRLKVVHVEAGRPSVAASAYARVASALGQEFTSTPARRPTLDELEDFMAS